MHFFDKKINKGLSRNLSYTITRAMNRGAQKTRAWREAQCPKVTQAEFARRFGYTNLTWSRIENGQWKPTVEMAVKLEQAGICSCEDWTMPPLPDDAPGEEAA